MSCPWGVRWGSFGRGCLPTPCRSTPRGWPLKRATLCLHLGLSCEVVSRWLALIDRSGHSVIIALSLYPVICEASNHATRPDSESGENDGLAGEEDIFMLPPTPVNFTLPTGLDGLFFMLMDTIFSSWVSYRGSRYSLEPNTLHFQRDH